LAEVEDRDEILKTLRVDLDTAAKAYCAAAAALSAERKTAAAKLAKLAEAQINSLAMKVRFEIGVHSVGDMNREGGGGFNPRKSLTDPMRASAPADEADPAAGNRKEKQSDTQSFVSGHDFSRAASAAKTEGALAPSGRESKGTGFSPYISSANSTGALAPEGNTARWTAYGWDEVEYRIATNAGEPLKPLHEIASGGEMSRVMLALKVSVEEGAVKPKKKTPTPRTLVFDEIDIGIGGRAAEAVGQKLKSLSRGQQVLCVTHLPQIAAFADQHFVVEKREADGRTKMQIRLLDDRARTHEVARMLSGAKVTDTSLQHAAQMIAASR